MKSVVLRRDGLEGGALGKRRTKCPAEVKK